jgi:hypothetical protein
MVISVFVFAFEVSVQAQGTVTFNHPWAVNGIAGFSLAYFDDMSFQVEPYPPQPHDNGAHVGVGLSGYPYDGTPYAAFVNTLGVPQHMAFAWTNAASQGHSFTNGAPFGLVSADLADPVAPSLASVAITFNGFKTDGSTASQTFTVGGGGSSSFQTVTFGQDFSANLLRVEIPSASWAMDNLVFIPEPGLGSLFALGGLLLLIRSVRKKA